MERALTEPQPGLLRDQSRAADPRRRLPDRAGAASVLRPAGRAGTSNDVWHTPREAAAIHRARVRRRAAAPSSEPSGSGLVEDELGAARVLEWQPVDLGGRCRREPVVGAIIANEYLDALPVHRLVQPARPAPRALRDLRGGGSPRSRTSHRRPRWRRHWQQDGVALAETTRRPRSRLPRSSGARQLGARAGARIALVIDYGHPADELYGPRRMAGA